MFGEVPQIAAGLPPRSKVGSPCATRARGLGYLLSGAVLACMFIFFGLVVGVDSSALTHHFSRFACSVCHRLLTDNRCVCRACSRRVVRSHESRQGGHLPAVRVGRAHCPLLLLHPRRHVCRRAHAKGAFYPYVLAAFTLSADTPRAGHRPLRVDRVDVWRLHRLLRPHPRHLRHTPVGLCTPPAHVTRSP